MKNAGIFLIWIFSVVLICSLAWGSFFQGGAGYIAVPHANIQLLIEAGRTVDETMDQVDKVILSLNYVKLSRNELLSDQERGYRKGNFKIVYSPEEGDYSSQALWIHFYQEDKYTFDDVGLAEYESLRSALVASGLKQSMVNDPRHPGRTIFTPEMFNQEYSGQEKPSGTQVVHELATLLCYTLIFLLPGFWIALKLLVKLVIPVMAKRVLFISVTSLLLAPAPLPIIMFGPIFLLPAPLALPFALESPEYLRLWLMSFAGTLFIAVILSLLIRTSSPPELEPQA
jgi:hypothetical protein